VHPVKTIAIAVLAWPVAEIVAFIAVAAAVGVFEAILLIMLTSLAGLLVLRHFRSGAQRLREGRGIFTTAVFGEGMGPVLGALLLLIPGFVSSAAGVLVLLPPSRRLLIALLRRLFITQEPVRRAAADPGVIDLTPEEWRPLPGETLPRPGTTPPRSGDDPPRAGANGGTHDPGR